MTDPFGTRTEISAEEYLEYIRAGHTAVFVPPVADTPPDWQTSEKAFMAKVDAFAKEHSWLTYHTWKSANSAPGFPDLVLARLPMIRVAELKVGNNKPTKHQLWWLDAFTAAGIPAAVWTPDMWQTIAEVLA